MAYAIETREDTNKTKRMLHVAEMRVLRSIAGKTRRDHGRQRRRQWYNHVKRMGEDRLPRITLEGIPVGSRPPRRPPKRWRDSWQSTSQELIQRIQNPIREDYKNGLPVRADDSKTKEGVGAGIYEFMTKIDCIPMDKTAVITALEDCGAEMMRD
ncbi:uncharacterized protein LOC132703194 [Cylas formicarius]|uniref:uncharacterized protein LOC132703194 n=1 Tax=Cylas formicarius TaxID=197179 RepID=UPI0029589C84|nr:uncharacterized protein LOC132703194 [Cylas formicarius]